MVVISLVEVVPPPRKGKSSKNNPHQKDAEKNLRNWVARIKTRQMIRRKEYFSYKTTPSDGIYSGKMKSAVSIP